MTLSIAAKYPWGPLRKLNQLQRNLPQAIILVSDSRWTRYYPNDRCEFEDVGTKVFALTSDSGIVYAGDVICGEHCITELSKRLKRNRKPSFKVSMYTAQQTFQRIYRYHKRRRNKMFPVYFLVGVCDKAGNASLMSFAPSKFAPVFIGGMYGIGVREAYKDFEPVINREIERRVKEEFDLRARYPILQTMPDLPIQNHAEQVGMLVAATMQTQVIGASQYSTIGGPIQYAIITKEGIGAPELSWTKDPTGITDTWHKTTASPSEITTYQDKYKLGPAFVHSSAFALYCIST